MAEVKHLHKLPRQVLHPSSLKAFKSKLNVLEYILILKQAVGLSVGVYWKKL